MPALGHKGSFAIVKEGTWGTDPATGYEYTPIKSEGMKVEPEYIFVKAIQASRNIKRKVQGAIKAGGTYTFDANVEEHLGILLKATLPTEATTDNGSGNGGLHVFTPGNTLPAGITALIDRDTTAGATNVWSFTGGRVRKLDFSAQDGGLLECSADLSFKNGVSGATAGTPSYSTENPLVYHQGVLTIDGSPVAVKSFKLSLESGLKDKRGKLGSQYIQQQQPGLYNITGEIEAYFDDMTLVGKITSGANVALVLTFTGSTLGTSTRTLIFSLPAIQLTGETPTMGDPEAETMLKLPFTAYQPSDGAELVSVSLLNSKRTAY